MRKTAYIYIKEDHGNRAYVNRTMPVIMNGYMIEQEWTAFCDRVDVALIPANGFKLRHRIFLPIFLVNFLLLPLSLCMAFGYPNNYLIFLENIAITGGPMTWRHIVLIHFILSGIIALGFISNIIIWDNVTSLLVRRNVETVCDELVQQKSELNIFSQDHLVKKRGRAITYYIEVRENGNAKVKQLENFPSPFIKARDAKKMGDEETSFA